MDIIESMIFDQSKASESEAAQRCRFHPEVRLPVAANRGMVHSRAPLSRRRRLNAVAKVPEGCGAPNVRHTKITDAVL